MQTKFLSPTTAAPDLPTFLYGEMRAWRRSALWIGLLSLAIAAIIAPQLPRTLLIDAGYEVGIGSDLPFLQNFNTFEEDANGTFRWTTGDSRVVVAGFGQRAALVQVQFFPFGAEVAAAGPQSIDIYADERFVATLPLRFEGSRQQVMIPPPSDGVLRLALRSPTFSLPNDERVLGTLVDRIVITSVPGGFSIPDTTALWQWLAALVCAWLALRHALEGSHSNGERRSTMVFAGFSAAVVAAALIDPARWAFGSTAAVTAAGLCYGLAVIVRSILPLFARKLAIPLDAHVLGWLCCFIVISFGLRYGGRLYPDSMPGDLGFHQNRFNETIWGLIHILSKNRGVDFPYPTAPYLAIAPLTLFGVHPRAALQIGAALADALSVALIYAIAVRIMSLRSALLAAGVYVFTAATFMVTWWSFATHIYTQFFHLLFIATLVWVWPHWQQQRGYAIGVALVASTLLLVFLGHFGFLINTALLIGGITALTWFMAWRKLPWAQVLWRPLTIAVLIAAGFAGMMFYSAYLPIFLGQVQTASEGGLTAVAGRGPVSRVLMWNTLWQAGLITHFGFFPLPLALWGFWLLWRDTATPDHGERRIILWLMGASLLVASIFAVLPFITGLTNSPRWMLFIAWVVALGSAVAVERLWQQKTVGRAAVLVMGALVLLNSTWIWLAPMLWRIRPPEPF